MITGLHCAVCGVAADIAQPFTWTCPNAHQSEGPHLFQFVDDRIDDEIDGSSSNPLIRYRRRSAWWAFARANGMSDVDAVELAASVGGAFTVTPFAAHAAISSALGLEVWAKDETAAVAGSHKARHLIGIMLHLRVAEELGILTNRPPLAISSCGNAALAAATIAAAENWPIRVFVPTWMDPAFGSGLDRLGAEVNRCERTEVSGPGDPAMAAFGRAVDDGAIPFSVQGPANAWCLDTGRTIGWEIAEQSPDGGLRAMYVQIGGGALATCLGAGLGGSVPLVAVQAEGCAPLSAALSRAEAFDVPEQHWGEVMVPWSNPASAADGILDDETYDWIGVRKAIRASGGRAMVAPEQSILDAKALVDTSGPPTSATGTAGLAGLMAECATGRTPEGPVGIVLSGVAR